VSAKTSSRIGIPVLTIRSNAMLSYNSRTLHIDVLIMPTKTHDIGAAWLDEEIGGMLYYQFLNLAERGVLTVASGTSISSEFS
jgi:hypothetical protein